MSLLALVLSHHRVPLQELEAASVPASALAEALPCLLRAPDVREAIVLSTCNRTEIYAWVSDHGAAIDQVELFLEDLKHLPAGWVHPRAEVLDGGAAIRHLFAVTTGLDSMVVGESEIQGQVRAAYRSAATQGAVGPHLHGLFRWALETGKRARAATGLCRPTDAFPKAAVAAIGEGLGGVAGREVLVVGNGRMAAASMRALSVAGARTAVVARREEAAIQLADRHGARSLSLPMLSEAMETADAAIFATSAPEPLIRTQDAISILARREGSPLVLVDLGLPRNVDPAVGELDAGVGRLMLLDLERLDREGHMPRGGRDAQLRAASDITSIEAERCVSWFRAKPADAVVAAIRASAERVAELEAARAVRGLSDLDAAHREAVERAIRRGVRKVVHLPTVRTKEACARGDDALLEAARWLFGVDGDGALGTGEWGG